jgi:pimeloyl-ACP methyl ester carboxylesterase
MSSIVLVHGAWSDASAWDHVAQKLTSAGHQVAVPDLPAHGRDLTSPTDATLEAYVATVITAAEGLAGPVVLVGHSMAGTVISVAAELRPDLVEHLVYLAAFLLPSGQSLYGFTQTSPGMASSALGPALRPGDGVLGVDPDQFIDAFCADATDEFARHALSSLRPDPLAPLGTPITVTAKRWGAVPRSYIHTDLDRCVSPASQAEMVAAVGVGSTRHLEAAHLAMLSQPDALTAAIIDLTSTAPASHTTPSPTTTRPTA